MWWHRWLVFVEQSPLCCQGNEASCHHHSPPLGCQHPPRPAQRLWFAPSARVTWTLVFSIVGFLPGVGMLPEVRALPLVSERHPPTCLLALSSGLLVPGRSGWLTVNTHVSKPLLLLPILTAAIPTRDTQTTDCLSGVGRPRRKYK